jgi:hypothetical protein
VTTAAERLKAAAARDEAAAEQPEPEQPAQPGEPEPAPPADEPHAPGPDAEPEEAEEGAQPGEPEQAATTPALAAIADSFDAEAFEREAKRHEKAVKRLLGAETVETICEACEGIGYVPPWKADVPQLRPNEGFRGCDVCDGLGLVATGSYRPGAETVDCPRCAGRGYLERVEPPPAVAPAGEANGAGSEWGIPPWAGDPNIRPQVPGVTQLPPPLG